MARRLNISDLHEYAQSMGGYCLSNKFTNSKETYEWKCKNGHNFSSSFYNVRHNGIWCKKCNLIDRFPADELLKHVEGKGGRIISGELLNRQSKLTVQCNLEHQWVTSVSSFRNGRWCPYCAGNKVDYAEEVALILEMHSGELITKNVKSVKMKLQWRCASGHDFKKSILKIKQSKIFCSHCNNTARLTLTDMNRLALEKGGVCLSSSYINSTSKLKWKCGNGHIFYSSASSVKNGNTWCPECNYYLNEEIYRSMFEHIFDTNFKKSRPDFLINNITGYRLELDGYSSELKIAFEYNGEQHYKNIFFGDHREKLKNIKIRDELKRRLCNQHGVKLFVIKYSEHIEDVFKKVRSFAVSIDIKGAEFKEFREFSPGAQVINMLDELQGLAKSKGGVLVSKSYLGSHRKHRWQCGEGHVWSAAVSKIKSDQWCPECAKNKKKTLQDFNSIIVQKGGKLITNKYINVDQLLDIECMEGHLFSLTGRQLLHSNIWCNHCEIKQYAERDIINYVESKGGRVIELEYTGSRSDECIIECSDLHRWKIKVGLLLERKSWCRSCNGTAKLSIDDMQQYAKSFGGVCVSQEYNSNRENLIWRCVNGHEWTATFGAMKRRLKFCKKCGR